MKRLRIRLVVAFGPSPAAYLSLALLALFAPAASAAVRYVSPTAPGPVHDGTSWDRAFASVKPALDASHPNDEVWVAAGVYAERVTVGPGVGLYGGFAGGETAREQRDPRAHQTVLDARGVGSVVTVSPSATPSTVIDGFTIRNGGGTPLVLDLDVPSCGGGVLCVTGSPTISHNIFTGNVADRGAGLFCRYGSPVVAYNVFVSNGLKGGIGTTDRGAGIYSVDASPLISENLFLNNQSDYAPGIEFVKGSPRIVANTLVGNESSQNSAAISGEGPEALVAGNLAAYNDGGIRYSQDGLEPPSGIRNNCAFGNTDRDYRLIGYYSSPTGGTTWYDYSLYGVNGNIVAEPRFIDRAGNDFRLRPDSPCIDAGDDSAVPDAFDLGGKPRRVGPHVDIGAYESPVSAGEVGYRVVRVSLGGSDDSDGSSWDRAKRTVEGALGSIPARAGGEVWVSAGVYSENLVLPAFASLYGGFAGSEPDRSQRDWVANPTVLDGGNKAPVVSIGIGATDATVVDGFTVRKGRSVRYAGGGVFCNYGTSATVSHNRFTVCGDPIGTYGANPRILDNVFAANNSVCVTLTATSGGVIANNTFAGNIDRGSGVGTAPAYTGGGILLRSKSSPLIANNVIAFNGYGVDMDSSNPGQPVLRNNDVYGNVRFDYGTKIGDQTGKNGNIKLDPRLADLVGENLHVQPDSPCWDAGDDSTVPAGASDIDGQPRIQGAAVDIGADESDGHTWTPAPPAIVRVSPSGNDANDGASWSTAKRTVQAAVDAAIPFGSEVWVAAGAYAEPVILRKPIGLYGGFRGTETARDPRDPGANVTVLSGTGANTVVTGSMGLPAAAPMVLDGFTIRNAGVGVSLNGMPAFIAHNVFAGNDGAVSAINADATVAYNVINGFHPAGVAVGKGTTYGVKLSAGSFTVADNIISGNAQGISLASATLTAASNTIAGCSEAGLSIGASVTATLSNNIIAFNVSGAKLATGATAALTWRNNDVFGNAGGDFVNIPSPTGQNGNLSVDPGFVDAPHGDLHILPDSPCRDAGDDAAAPSGATDIDGQPRIQGAAVDIGADESDGTIHPTPVAVVRVAPDGDDAADGSSWARARKTIQGAIDGLALGGEVWVKEGTYPGGVVLPSFTSLLGGFAGVETAADQRNPMAHRSVVTGPIHVPELILVRGAYSTIDGLEVVASPGAYPGYETSGIASSGLFTVLRRNVVTGFRTNGLLAEAPGAVVENNVARRNGSGIRVTGGNARAAHNLAQGNGTGFVVGAGVFANNTAVANTGTGFVLWSNATLVNSLSAYNSVGIGYSSSTAPAVTLSHNDAYGNFLADYRGLSDPTGTNGNVRVDPLLSFPAGGMAHIQPWSSCRDAGDDSVVRPGDTDIDGQPAVQGAHVDIGADESNGTVWPVTVRRRYVRAGGNDTADGASWATAKATVPAGIDALVETGGELWVATGRYVGDVSVNALVSLYGGFASGETERGQRAWARNATIIEGRVTVTGGGPGNAVDGFTIRRAFDSFGGGIALKNSSITVSHNRIVENFSQTTGGGIHSEGGSPTIRDNLIAGNHSGWGSPNGGGGIYITSGLVMNNTIVGNTSVHAAGGVGFALPETYETQLPPPVFVNNIIAYNSGGVAPVHQVVSDKPVAVFRNNCVFGNYGGDYVDMPDPTGQDGNIRQAPLFANYAFGNVHLQPGSPCIDTGDGSGVQPGDGDLDGQSRVMGRRVDIGVDESDGTFWLDAHRVIRVRPDGNDAADGSSWPMAMKTLTAALEAARKTGGAEVWAARGVYRERIQVPPFTYLYGGFAGAETNRANRDWNRNLSIVDAQRGGSAVTILNGYRVSRLDGFTVRNGLRTDTVGIAQSSGSGVLCFGASPTIVNNVIVGNTGFGSYEGGSGSAVYLSNTDAQFVNNVVRGNGGRWCGGVYFGGFGHPTIANNTVIGNTGQALGLYSSGAAVYNNLIAFNHAGVFVYLSQLNPPVYDFHHNNVFGNEQYDYASYEYVTPPDYTGQNGNIREDPMLASVPLGDPHLQPDSPCIDAGTEPPSAIDTDFDGQLRVQGAKPDIGADEADGLPHEHAPLIIRVSPDGNDANNGATWATAKRSVQAAVDTASVAGGQVWVRAGTYLESVSVPPYCYVYGGFEGAETVREQRDWARNICVLDAGRRDSVVRMSAGHRVSALDGFTLRNGQATLGGGIRCETAGPFVSHNVLIDNQAIGAPDWPSGLGGGAYFYNASPVFTNNLVWRNASPRGAGVYIETTNGLMANNTIVGNTGGDGAAVYSDRGGFMVIANNIVAGNDAGMFGSSNWDPSPTVRRNVVFDNGPYNYYRLGPGDGDLQVDPLFVDPAGGDFRLRAGSPCLDRGDDALVAMNDRDLAARPRILGRHVDIGAYEAPAPGIVTLGSVARALRIAAGLTPSLATDLEDLDMPDTGEPGHIGMADAARIARKAAGLDANP